MNCPSLVSGWFLFEDIEPKELIHIQEWVNSIISLIKKETTHKRGYSMNWGTHEAAEVSRTWALEM